MYRNSAGSVLGVMTVFVIFMSLPPVQLRRVCLASLCAGQCSMKC
jgi:hypothetical protein